MWATRKEQMLLVFSRENVSKHETLSEQQVNFSVHYLKTGPVLWCHLNTEWYLYVYG